MEQPEHKSCIDIPCGEPQTVSLTDIEPIKYQPLTLQEGIEFLTSNYQPGEQIPFRSYDSCFPGNTMAYAKALEVINQARTLHRGPTLFGTDDMALNGGTRQEIIFSSKEPS